MRTALLRSALALPRPTWVVVIASILRDDASSAAKRVTFWGLRVTAALTCVGKGCQTRFPRGFLVPRPRLTIFVRFRAPQVPESRAHSAGCGSKAATSKPSRPPTTSSPPNAAPTSSNAKFAAVTAPASCGSSPPRCNLAMNAQR